MYKSMDLENIFQLTTSRGGRQSGNLDIADYKLFSTHDLSWRSTSMVYGHGRNVFFSTHDLSWRSTEVLLSDPEPGIFQLTTSRGGRQESEER